MAQVTQERTACPVKEKGVHAELLTGWGDLELLQRGDWYIKPFTGYQPYALPRAYGGPNCNYILVETYGEVLDKDTYTID